MAAEGSDRFPEITEEQVQALADPAFLTDPSGCVAVWNRGATELLGHTSIDAVGARCSMLLDGVGARGAQVCTQPCPMVRGVLPTRRSPREGRHPDMLARNSWGERTNLSVIAIPVTVDGTPMLLHLLRGEPRSERDALTGTLSRDAFAVRVVDEQHRAARMNVPLALALVDVDGLKAINDAFGHGAGDRVLIAIAGALRAGRRTDLVGRWGGDEFAVLLPGTHSAEAARRLQRTLDALKASAIIGDRPSTFSAGVVAVDPHAPVEHVMRIADAAAYRAKRAGRARVVLDIVTPNEPQGHDL